jgi:hypothetical protein
MSKAIALEKGALFMFRIIYQAPLMAILISQMIFLPIVRADIDSTGSYTVHKEDPTYKAGSVFVDSDKKNEVLLKANIWGAVQFPGVHYMPFGTRFLDALSFAGGPLDSANSDEITLATKPVANAKGETVRMLSVKDALASEKNNPIIQPDDIIVVNEDHSDAVFFKILAVGTFIVSAAALGVVIAK